MLKNVFIICSGVGHVNRGYESFATESNDAIKDTNQFKTIFLKGAGDKINNEIPLWCLRRNAKFTRFVSRITRKEPYWLEQFTFALSMIPALIRYKPAVILYWDFNLGTFLWHFRRFFRFKYKLLFSNGAPNGPPFTRMDHVQQHLPVHYNTGIAGGTPHNMQTLLPCGIHISVEKNIGSLQQRKSIREKLHLPQDKKIIITVGAVNRGHKRIDYVVDELSQLSDDFFLVVLGQVTDDTAAILEEANTKLKGRYMMKNVAREEVDEYYKACDVFVLASFTEGLPRVLPEALSFGLPCFVHEYAVTKETLGMYGHYINAAKKGALANALQDYFAHQANESKRAMVQYAYDTYSWDVLANRYINMITALF
jgi:glycosyltransferase involved in cell wall biosynthesis